jgi:hypothetical protein
MRLEALEHLFFNVFDVGEPAPTSDIAVFRCTLNLHNKFSPTPLYLINAAVPLKA